MMPRCAGRTLFRSYRTGSGRDH